MPNYVRVRIVGKDMEALKNAIVDEHDNVDFNKLIPRPKDLDITCGSFSFREEPGKDLEAHQKIIFTFRILYAGTKSQEEFVNKCKENDVLIELITNTYFNNKFLLEDKEQLKEAIETYIKGFYNLTKHGFVDWYDWSNAKWGTKWNAGDSVVADDYIEFETAWSLPTPVCEALAQVTPIRVVYADEDKGYNCGMVDFFLNEYKEVESGVVMEGSRELAYDTWGYSHIPVYDEDSYDEIEDMSDPRIVEANKDYNTIQEKIASLMTSEELQKDYAEV